MALLAECAADRAEAGGQVLRLGNIIRDFPGRQIDAQIFQGDLFFRLFADRTPAFAPIELDPHFPVIFHFKLGPGDRIGTHPVFPVTVGDQPQTV